MATGFSICLGVTTGIKKKNLGPKVDRNMFPGWSFMIVLKITP